MRHASMSSVVNRNDTWWHYAPMTSNKVITPPYPRRHYPSHPLTFNSLSPILLSVTSWRFAPALSHCITTVHFYSSPPTQLWHYILPTTFPLSPFRYLIHGFGFVHENVQNMFVTLCIVYLSYFVASVDKISEIMEPQRNRVFLLVCSEMWCSTLEYEKKCVTFLILLYLNNSIVFVHNLTRYFKKTVGNR